MVSPFLVYKNVDYAALRRLRKLCDRIGRRSRPEKKITVAESLPKRSGQC